MIICPSAEQHFDIFQPILDELLEKCGNLHFIFVIFSLSKKVIA